MSDVTKKVQRPLSPHLQVYRLPYNATMSISGRGVGIGLAVGISLFFAWFVGAVWYPPLYDFTMGILNNPFTLYGLLLICFVVFFYLGNGIRHVIWDMSIGLNVKFGVVTGNIALATSAL